MRKRANMKGWTLIELIIVIVIIGLLAVVALPRYFDLRTEAAKAANDGVVGAVRSGIAIFAADQLVNEGTLSYPASLGNNFENVLDYTADGWTEDPDHTWTPPNTSLDTRTWTYTPATGKFEEN